MRFVSDDGSVRWEGVLRVGRTRWRSAAPVVAQGLDLLPGTIANVEGVRDAVAAGRIGQQFVDAARKVARAAVRTRRSPTGQGNWSDSEIEELVHETIVRVGTDKVVLAASEAANDRQFIWGWLKIVLCTTLNIRARGTPSGRVIRAMDDALRGDPNQFCLANGYWR